MVGSSIYTLLAIIAIAIQSCPLTDAKSNGSKSAHHRSHNSNTNINTNINTFRKSRRLYEAIARAEAESQDEKPDEKDVQTAVIAGAAAEAAKTVTRALTKKLTENTADAVADAVIRVLTEEDDKKIDKDEQEEQAKSVKRASRFLTGAFARLLYRSDQNTPPSDAAESESTDVPPEVVEKMLETAEPPEENNTKRWIDGDGKQIPIDPADTADEPAARFYRRYIDSPDSWKTYYRRSAPVRHRRFG